MVCKSETIFRNSVVDFAVREKMIESRGGLEY